VYRGRVLQHARVNADGDAVDPEDGTAVATNGQHVSDDSDAEENGSTQASQGPDPTTAWVMAVYENAAGEEQKWKRSITSSGTSEYRLNDQRVDAKEYNEALEAEQILIKARNFLVFQGDVEAIASQNPLNLTRLFEQVSGSLEYKKDYEDLKAEYERNDEINTSKMTQRRGINSEVKQYSEQKQEADRYARKQTERDDAIINHALWKLHNLDLIIDESTEEIGKHRTELAQFRRDIEESETAFESGKTKQADAKRQAEVTERGIARKSKQIESAENNLLPMTEKITISQKKIESAESRISSVTKERDGHAKTVDKLQKDLTNVEKAKTKWEDEWRVAQQQTGRELDATDLQEYDRLKADVSRQTATSQVERDDVNRNLKSDEETIKSLQAKVDSSKGQQTRLGDEIKELTTRQADLKSNAKSIAEQVSQKTRSVSTLQSKRRTAQQSYNEMDEKLREVIRKLEEFRSVRQESEKDVRTRELTTQLKKVFPGVRGALHNLCKSKEKRFNQSTVTVLGRHIDSMIVDTEKTAKDCIEYLKKQRLGVLTFIPLDTIMYKVPNSSLRSMHEGMRPALDTIQFDNVIERAVSFACADAVVCDTLQIARHLCFERRIDARAVTLDGTVISKGGNMTGGQSLQQRLQPYDYNDADFDNLMALKDKYMADLAKMASISSSKDEEDELQGQLTGLKLRQQLLTDESEHLTRNLQSKERELQFLQNQLTETEAKLSDESRGLDGLRARLDTATNQISSVEDQVFAQFCRRLGYMNIRAYDAQQGSIQKEAAQKKLEFTTQISKLKGQLTFEKDRLAKTDERIARIRKDADNAQSDIDGLESEKAQLDLQLEKHGAELDELNQQLEERKATLKERADVVNKARREIDKRTKSVEKALKDVESLEEQIASASLSRYTVLRSCLIDKIDIPLERGSKPLSSLPDDVNVEIADDELDEDEDAMEVDGQEGGNGSRNTNYKDYGIKVKFDKLSDDLKEAEDEEATDKKLQEIIDRLRVDLEKMAPNSRAQERLDSTNIRLKDYDIQCKQAAAELHRSKKAFEEVRDKRVELFNKAYSHVCENIDNVYKELTRSGDFQGGRADLSLEDEAEPYLAGISYSTMPPMKRYRDMEALSGGEKTMAALALLFAIHTYSPSPFFVLDEVDAALDNVNTDRLANYLASHAGPGMQFVVISLKVEFFP